MATTVEHYREAERYLELSHEAIRESAYASDRYAHLAAVHAQLAQVGATLLAAGPHSAIRAQLTRMVTVETVETDEEFLDVVEPEPVHWIFRGAMPHTLLEGMNRATKATIDSKQVTCPICREAIDRESNTL